MDETRQGCMIVLRYKANTIVAENARRLSSGIVTRITKRLSDILGVNVSGTDTTKYIRNNVEKAHTLKLYGDRFDVLGEGWGSRGGHRAFLHFV